MQRSIVSVEELLKVINQRLQACQETVSCTAVGPIKSLPAPLSDGGNWNRSLTIRGQPTDPYAAGEAAHDIIAEVANEYNLGISAER